MSNWLEQYTAEVRSGRIIAGQEIHMLIERLEKNREKYAYDTREAERRINFMENVVRLTKSPFYGQPMVLMLWQKAFIETIYSFKTLYPNGRIISIPGVPMKSHKSQEYADLYRKILLEIARKNAKTETCSGLSFTELVVGENGADISVSGNDDDQSKILYDSIDTMRMLVDPNSRVIRKTISKITCPSKSTSVIRISDKKQNKEGRNLDFAIIDEVHEMHDNTLIKAVEQSQSLKRNPKLIMITTEGFTTGGFLDEELAYARRVLSGEECSDATERYLPWLYTQDSENEIFQDPSSWQKSNPSIGIIKPYDSLAIQVDAAKTRKTERAFVLAKDFNIKQNTSEAWLMEEDYNYPCTFDIEMLRGGYYIGAVDLSATTDLTCATAMVPIGDIKYKLTRYFIPESKLLNSPDKQAGARYEQWAEDGLLEIMPGNDNDLAAVADWFYSLYLDFGITPYKVGYDQRFARDFLMRMKEIGIECEMVYQNAATLSNACRLLEADLKSNHLLYDDNPMDRWCFSNAAIKTDNYGQVLIVKAGNPSKRIDGAVTTAILYEMYRRYRSELIGANEHLAEVSIETDGH
jgi:phage terminase large subunit-like protein